MVNIAKIPTLRVIGKGYKVIPYEISMKLTEIYENRNVFFNELGHYINIFKKEIQLKKYIF